MDSGTVVFSVGAAESGGPAVLWLEEQTAIQLPRALTRVVPAISTPNISSLVLRMSAQRQSTDSNEVLRTPCNGGSQMAM